MAVRIVGLVLVAAVSASACVRAATPTADRVTDDDALTVGSYNFPESVLLAEIYAQALEGEGFAVEREPAIGTRELVMPALVGGLIEFVPEYSGSGLLFLAGPGSTSPDPSLTNQRLVRELGALGVVALRPSPAQDKNGFAVTADTAQRYDLATLSDLARVADRLVFGGPPECTTRPLCLPGLRSTYGIEFGDVVATLDVGGPRTIAALAEGTVDVALLFTSDGAIELNDFVVLQDDRDLQPAENVTPVIRQDALERFGTEILDIANAVSAQLTTADLRAMNARIASGREPHEVASDWLSSAGAEAGLG